MKLEFKTTSDGSHTLFVPELNEHYHSTNGAIQESKHVFIEAAFNNCSKSNINILEVGFGTGLNAFMTFLESENMSKAINYTTLELYPISYNNIEKLNYAQLLDIGKLDIFRKLHTAQWEVPEQITNNFSILKKNIDFSNPDNFITSDTFDIVYFDVFGPEKQPEMWSPDIFRKIYSLMNSKGIITTYSAKGSIRRMMQSIGLEVERIPGPPGKREMLRAIKP